MTLDEAAPRLDKTKSALNRVETGKALETEASTKWESTLLHVPGLLQTEDYMWTLFANNPGTSAGVSRGGNGTGARLHRQRRLTDPDFPIEEVAIINEAALRANVGGDHVMRAQLQHLVRQAELPNVTIQVLLNRDGTHRVPAVAGVESGRLGCLHREGDRRTRCPLRTASDQGVAM